MIESAPSLPLIETLEEALEIVRSGRVKPPLLIAPANYETTGESYYKLAENDEGRLKEYVEKALTNPHGLPNKVHLIQLAGTHESGVFEPVIK